MLHMSFQQNVIALWYYNIHDCALYGSQRARTKKVLVQVFYCSSAFRWLCLKRNTHKCIFYVYYCISIYGKQALDERI